jgi:hypothetical protein
VLAIARMIRLRAQEFQGIAVYESKTSMDLRLKDGRE